MVSRDSAVLFPTPRTTCEGSLDDATTARGSNACSFWKRSNVHAGALCACDAASDSPVHWIHLALKP